MQLSLPDDICSLQDLKAVTLELRDHAKQRSHTEIKQRVHAKKHKQTTDVVVLSPAAETLLRDWGKTESTDSRGLEKLIAELEDYADAAQTITITVAAPPSVGLKKQLVAWCRQNISQNILVTVQFNSALLGGLVVRHGSRIFDWSFRRALLENRSKFPEVLRSV